MQRSEVHAYLASRKPLFIRVSKPEAARVWGVDFINETQRALAVYANLVLGVYEQQPTLCGFCLPKRKES
jgi:hypothetical protein